MNTFDAIVIGSGISGGWAAKELCEQGLQTLVLERGRQVTHIDDYPTARKNIWELPHRGKLTHTAATANPITSQAWHYAEETAHFFVKDADHPYVQVKPFSWIRGYQVGGRSLTWGRACQRWSENEFRAPAQYGYGIDWPMGYADIAPWYAHVEQFAGICGNRDGVPSMPDGEFLKPFDLNVVEKHMQAVIRKHYPDRHMVQGRWAHLSEPKEIHLQQGRGKCQCRNLCARGCPYGGYFSSNAATLPWADKTGNLTLRPFSVVHSVLYDEKSGKATGVKVIDTNTKEEIIFKARIIFINASTINTNLILLNSRSNRFPNGLGNDNGLLGKYICFQSYRASTHGKIDGFENKYVEGRNPTGPIIPNFRNFHKRDSDFLGGYTSFIGALRYQASEVPDGEPQLGIDFKHKLSEAGDWVVYMYMQGETLPKITNWVTLSKHKKDQWGIPLIEIDVSYDDNDAKMAADFIKESKEMLAKMGCRDIVAFDNKQTPGLDIHEMGGVRMGRDPETSLLNGNNQLHHCQNVFVTDGACMASTGNQSPSVFYMAITARAATYAATLFKKGKL